MLFEYSDAEGCRISC